MPLTPSTPSALVQAALSRSEIAGKALQDFAVTNNPFLIPNADAKLAASVAALAAIGYTSGPPNIDVMPGVGTARQVATFTNAANTTTGGTDNTDDPYPGTTSSVTVNLNPGQTKDIRPVAIGTAISLVNGIVRFAVRVRPSSTYGRAIATMGTCWVNLYNDASSSGTKNNYLRARFGDTSFNGEGFADGWQNFAIPVEAFGQFGTVADATAYLATVRYAGLSFTHSSVNSDPFSVSVTSVTVTPKSLNKGLVIFGFDDCRRDTYAYAYPILKQYGFPGVLYPGAVLACMDQNNTFFMSKANMRELQANGWQVASQAYTTESPTMSLADFQIELDNLLAFNALHGFEGGADGSYFSNVNFGSQYQAAFDAHFRSMRGFRQYNDAASPRPDTMPFAQNNRRRSYGVNTATNSATNGLIPFFQRAADWKGVAEVTYHAVGSGDVKHAADGGTLTSFEAAVAWCAANRDKVDVVTPAEAIRRGRSGLT